jgi:Sporulation and spore germination
MRAVKRRLAGIALACLLTGACGIPADDTPRDIGRPRPSSGSNPPRSDRLGSAVERLYLVRDGALTRVVRRTADAPNPQKLLDDLLAGPTRAETEDGVTSALSTTDIVGMTVVQRRATIAVGSPTAQGARSDETLAYGQIVCTLTSQSTEVGTVSFTRGGRPLGVPRGDGSLSTGPLTIADYSDLLKP